MTSLPNRVSKPTHLSLRLFGEAREIVEAFHALVRKKTVAAFDPCSNASDRRQVAVGLDSTHL